MPYYSASTSASETETRLPRSPPSPCLFALSGQYIDNDNDIPVHVDGFLRNVRLCKSALGLSLLGTFATEVWHLSMSVAELGHWRHSGTQQKAVKSSMWLDVLGTIIIVSVEIAVLEYLCHSCLLRHSDKYISIY